MKQWLLLCSIILWGVTLLAQPLKELDNVGVYDKPYLIVTTMNSEDEFAEMREKFNKQGKIVERKYYGDGFQLIKGVRYHYNKNGELESESLLNGFGEVYDSIVYRYNQKGECMATEVVNRKWTRPTWNVQREFDNLGRVNQQWLIHGETGRRQLMKQVTYKQDHQGNVEEELYRYADGSESAIIIDYNREKKPKRKIFERIDGTTRILEEINYNKNGYINNITLYNNREKPMTKYVYGKRDREGNWLTMKETNYYDSEKVVKSYKRKITYY